MDAFTKEDFRTFEKINELVRLKIDEELATTYCIDSKFVQELFKSDCKQLPYNEDGFNTDSNFISFSYLYRLIGMIKRGELILNPEFDGKE